MHNTIMTWGVGKGEMTEGENCIKNWVKGIKISSCRIINLNNNFYLRLPLLCRTCSSRG